MQSQSQSHSHAPAQTPAVSSVQRHVVRRDSAQGEVSIDVRVDVRVDVRANSARHAPQLVLLPSLGRDSDDFDVIASALADKVVPIPLCPAGRDVLSAAIRLAISSVKP
jgi:hypothetical protein